MGAPEPLKPLITMSWAFGAGTILTTKPPRGASRFLRGRLTRANRDQGTAAYLAPSGAARGIAARETVGQASLDLLEEAGLPLRSGYDTYGDERGYERLVRRRAAEGHRFAVTHYHPLAQLPAESWWVDPAVVSDLNDKGSLERYVPAGHYPRRRLVPRKDIPQVLREFRAPYLLKVSTGWSSASGMGVRIVSTPAEARAVLHEWRDIPLVVVEEFQTFSKNLCLNYASDGKRIRYLGAGEQQVDGSAYLGSWVDRGSRAPAAAIALGQEIMERGRRKGYRGIAGFDIGITPAGHPIAFDLNFRLCGSTFSLLYQRALRQRSVDASCSSTIRAEGPQGAGPMLAAARRALRAGIFIPYAVFTPRQETRRTLPAIYGLVLGRDRNAVEKNRLQLVRAGLR